MPHYRNRHIATALKKKMRFSPVVAIQGVRQSGKSFFVRELLPKEFTHAHYETFDRKITREFASTNPETFLVKFAEMNPLIIDEAQKVPGIFDAVKFLVDQKRTPGKFLLLGSTEFSKATLISESLTGRMSRIRIFPMTLSETLSLPQMQIKLMDPFCESPRVTRTNLVKYLECGGMPAIFSVRSAKEQELAFEDWINLTCDRDLMQIPKLKLESSLARNILEKVATLAEPTAGSIAASLGKDLRKIVKHLDSLETLFVIQKLTPHLGSAGKPSYYLCDTGIASFLGATFERKLETHLLLHISAAMSYQMEAKARLSFYRSSTGARVHLLVTVGSVTTAIKIMPTEKVDLREIAALAAIKKKFPGIRTIAYGPERFSMKKEKIEIFPWEALG
jgi:uncharacterized protein